MENLIMSMLDIALAKKRQLDEQSKKLEEYIEAQSKAEALGLELGLIPQKNESILKNESQIAHESPKLATRETIRMVGKACIIKNGPQSVQAIIETIEGQGLKIAGKNPVAYASQALSLDPEFVSNRKTGWNLKSLTLDLATEKGESPTTGNSEAFYL
jgi:hypothetical protein